MVKTECKTQSCCEIYVIFDFKKTKKWRDKLIIPLNWQDNLTVPYQLYKTWVILGNDKRILNDSKIQAINLSAKYATTNCLGRGEHWNRLYHTLSARYATTNCCLGRGEHWNRLYHTV